MNRVFEIPVKLDLFCKDCGDEARSHGRGGVKECYETACHDAENPCRVTASEVWFYQDTKGWFEALVASAQEYVSAREAVKTLFEADVHAARSKATQTRVALGAEMETELDAVRARFRSRFAEVDELEQEEMRAATVKAGAWTDPMEVWKTVKQAVLDAGVHALERVERDDPKWRGMREAKYVCASCPEGGVCGELRWRPTGSAMMSDADVADRHVAYVASALLDLEFSEYGYDSVEGQQWLARRRQGAPS